MTSGGAVLAMERAQIIFLVPFTAVALLIAAFAIFVAWTTMWGNRWYRRPRK